MRQPKAKIDQPNEDEIQFKGDVAANLNLMGVLCENDHPIEHPYFKTIPSMFSDKEMARTLNLIAD